MTNKTENYRERAVEVLGDMRRERGGAQDRQAMAAEAQAWASLAIAEAIHSASSSLQDELQNLKESLSQEPPP